MARERVFIPTGSHSFFPLSTHKNKMARKLNEKTTDELSKIKHDEDFEIREGESDDDYLIFRSRERKEE